MLQTLFFIPLEIGGVPVFGFGLLLAAWAVVSVVILAVLVWRQGLTADTFSYVPLLALVGAVIWWLLPVICVEGGLPIRGYGVMMLVGVASATALLTWRAVRVGLQAEMMFSLVFWGFVPGIIGARLFYVIEYWPSFQRPTTGATLGAMVNIAQGGLVVYGSLIGGTIGLVAFMRTHKLPVLATLDLLTPSLVLGLAIGRIGCLLNGCCFGGPCDLPWAVTFPAGSPAHVQQAHRGHAYVAGLKLAGDKAKPPMIAEVEPDSDAQHAGMAPKQRIVAINDETVRTVEEARRFLMYLDEPGKRISILTEGSDKPRAWTVTRSSGSLPVHPTQIYSSINALLICLFLLAYDRFRRRDGELFALLLTLYPVTRFLLEIIRIDESAVFGTGLSISQNVSLLMLVGTAGLWFYILSHPPGVAFRRTTVAGCCSDAS